MNLIALPGLPGSAEVPSIRDLVRLLMLVVPFRVFGFAACPLVLPPRVILWGLAARSEFLTR